MSNSPFTSLVLDDYRREIWQRALLSLSPQSGSGNLEELLDPAATIAEAILPSELIDAMMSTTQPDGPAVMVIDNLPIDPVIPPPPTDGKRPAAKRTFVSELALLGATRALGLEVLAFQQEKQGAWPQEVAPVTGLEKTNSSASREDFGPHADNAILDPAVRLWISLIGLVNTCQTETYFAPLDEILGLLPPEIIDLLRQPIFKVTFPESFVMGEPVFKTQPILFTGPGGQTEIKFNSFKVVGTTPAAQAAIDMLLGVLPAVLKPIVLKPGTLCLFSNTRCLHSRGRIEGDRWAQRIYLCQPETLSRLKQATGADAGQRVFDARQLVIL